MKEGGALGLFSVKNLIYKSKSKKMDNKNLTKIEERKLNINQIEGTPFVHAQVGDKNYLVCGNIKLELDDDMDLAKVTQWLNDKPWDAICLAIEAMLNKLNNK